MRQLTKQFLGAAAIQAFITGVVFLLTPGSAQAAPEKNAAPAKHSSEKAKPEQGSTIEEVAKKDDGKIDPTLPNVLIVGDSISLGYTPPLRDLLKGKANILHARGNSEGTTSGVKNIDQWLGTTHWDVIHFNFGLHDIKRVVAPGDSGTTKDVNNPQQAEPDAYEANLEKIVARLEKSGARLVFATTTPVPSGPQMVARKSEDVPIYNGVAMKVMKRHGIPVNDLYAFCMPKVARIQKPHNVHFTDEGSQDLAKEVAAAIGAQLDALPGKGIKAR